MWSKILSFICLFFEYTELGHKCQNPDCDGELERDMSDFAGGFIWKCHGSYAKG